MIETIAAPLPMHKHEEITYDTDMYTTNCSSKLTASTIMAFLKVETKIKTFFPPMLRSRWNMDMKFHTSSTVGDLYNRFSELAKELRRGTALRI